VKFTRDTIMSSVSWDFWGDFWDWFYDHICVLRPFYDLSGHKRRQERGARTVNQPRATTRGP